MRLNEHDPFEDSCPDLGHSSLHCLGMCPSGPSVTKREQREQRGFIWMLRTMENLWEVPHYTETTLGMGEENPRRKKVAINYLVISSPSGYNCSTNHRITAPNDNSYFYHQTIFFFLPSALIHFWTITSHHRT